MSMSQFESEKCKIVSEIEEHIISTFEMSGKIQDFRWRLLGGAILIVFDLFWPEFTQPDPKKAS